VPGTYERPGTYKPLAKTFHAAGHHDIHVTSLLSTGTSSKSGIAPSVDVDRDAVAAHILRVVEMARFRGVVTLMHSTGGFIKSVAMEGMLASARSAEGKAKTYNRSLSFVPVFSLRASNTLPCHYSTSI
jgi:pimeloyl-ACP methyl ester carboxylesterase